MRVLLVLSLLAASLFAAAVSGAAPSTGKRNASARLLACDTQMRRATFQGVMKALPRGNDLSMRFGLEIRRAAAERWERVKGFPDFATMDVADPDTERYISDRTVEGLLPGLSYRAVVRFRWRSPKGRVVARAVKTTRPCRQPDTRADLEPMRISVESGPTDGTRFYSLRVRNAGQSDAPAFSSRLAVAGVTAEDATGEPLAPGDDDVLLFEAPACAPGSQIAATVDVGGAVDESDELDNVLTVDCPGN